jgi:predicted transcriptional regulator
MVTESERPCYPEVTEVHFTPELQARLDHAAAAIPVGSEQYVRKLVEHYLDHSVWFRQKVASSSAILDRGESLSHDEIGERLKKMFAQ